MDPANPFRRAVAGALYDLKTILARYAIALPMQRVRGRGEVVEAGTDVVIEGFPRCASSFVVAAFRLAQEPRATRIAHHTHMPAQVAAAARMRVPTIVLIREPQATIVSHLIRNPDLPAGPAVRGYVRFYAPLVRHRASFVIGDFAEITTDLGATIGRLNDLFGTAFRPYEHTPEHLARITREIDEDYRSRAGSDAELERIVPRPSREREALREGARARYLAVPVGLRRRAEALYRALAG